MIRINKVLSELDIKPLQRRVIPELSSGELQRVFLASALAFTPPIIVLDEPIARIDSKTEIKLVDKLRELADQGHLVIAFEHRLDYILKKADRLIVLDKGKIVSDGVPLNLLDDLLEIDPPELSLLELHNSKKIFSLDDSVDYNKIATAIKDCKIQIQEDNTFREKKDPAVVLNNINFRYSNKTNWILNDLNLHLNRGESIGLIGINGSGKSTLMKIILGIERSRKGEVLIQNSIVKRIRNAKKECIYVPENAKLFLIGPTPLRDLEMQLKSTEEATKIYQKFKMNRLMKRKLYHLSEGERRLFAIINSFHFHENIILLDEPTIALDRKGREILLKLVEDSTDKGKTVILASNDPRIITSLDRIIVIENSKIVLDGSPREILYKLENQTNLIPNQTVRFIQQLEEKTGLTLPKVLNPKEFNSLVQEDN